MLQRKRNIFRPRRPLGSFLLTTATFIAFLAIVWHAYQSNVSQNRAESSVPLIRASADPIKSKPVDEMGMEIPYQDMLVFDQIEEPFAGKERDVAQVKFLGDDSAEDALPSLQELTKLDDGFSGEAEKAGQVASLNTIEPASSPALSEPALSKIEQEVSAAGEAVTETVTQETKVITLKKTEPKQEKAEASAAKTETPKTVSASGDYIVQLGSVRSESGAKDEWNKLSQKLPGVLTSLSLNVEKADLGAKGVFYRIQGGKVSKDEASSICDKVKTTGKDCLIKKVQ